MRLASRLGWNRRESKSVAALARIRLEFGAKVFRLEALALRPDFSALLCFKAAHRAGGECDCDAFDDCLCRCHYCRECDWFESTCDGQCDCECHADLSDSDYEEDENAEDEEGEEDEEDGRCARCESWHDEDPYVEATPDGRVAAVASRLLRGGGAFDGRFVVVDRIDGQRLQGTADADQHTVQITGALVDRLDDDALAFVLAHEIAHFEHHDHERATAHARRQAEVVSAAIKRNDEEMRAAGAGPFRRGVALAALAAAGVGMAYLGGRAHSRRCETEADGRAIDLMRKARFDPASAPSALLILHGGVLPSTGIVESLTSTHPDPMGRADDLSRHASEGPPSLGARVRAAREAALSSTWLPLGRR